MSQRAQGRVEAGTSYGHHLVDGEWVELVSDGQGRIVPADGDWSDPDEWVEPETLTDFGRYEFTMIVDGVPVHAYEETALSFSENARTTRLMYRNADGTSSYLDGAATEIPEYSHTVITDEGTLEHRYGHAGAYTLDEHGATVMSEGRETDHDIRFESFAEYEGRRAVVGIDGDGEQVLLTPSGFPIEADVDWSSVRLIETPALDGEPIAIGDYVFDPGFGGRIERVYLFRDGSQAIKGDDGEFRRVIVPTDAEYPVGRPVFQGNFYAGEDRTTSNDQDDFAFAPVFAFRDGQTATWVDGELVLVDMPIEVHVPEGAPVACGRFPGGDLFVFEDGTQLLRAPDGQWGIGTLPDIPPFEELVERYGEPDLDVLYDDPVLDDGPTLVPTADLLVDDITAMDPGVAEPGSDAMEPATADEIGVDDTVDVAGEAVPPDDESLRTVEASEGVLIDDGATTADLADPFEADPTDLANDPVPDEEAGDQALDDPLDASDPDADGLG